MNFGYLGAAVYFELEGSRGYVELITSRCMQLPLPYTQLKLCFTFLEVRLWSEVTL